LSKKSPKIAALIEGCQGKGLDPHYLGYFECFNRQLFYEAHDVLEELWLTDRKGPKFGFYKGLIQFAGAFVHLQKNRLRPAAALFKLSRSYLEKYPSPYEQLDLIAVLRCSDDWVKKLEATDFSTNPLTAENAPRLTLLPN
jgi:predicted metal-dependent hydrolase